MALIPVDFGGKKVVKDSITGREVWQMTSGDYTSHAPYMYCQAFTSDERYMVFSSNRTGIFQLYRLDVDTGEAMQLTNLPDYDNNSPKVGPGGNEVYISSGSTARVINILTGEEMLVVDFSHLTEGKPLHTRPVFSGDGKVIVAGYVRGDGKIAIARTDDKGSKPEEIYVFPPADRITHINFHPMDNDFITYVPVPDTQNDMELPQVKRARAWKLTLSTGENSPYLIMPKGFRATHEYWSPDGTRLYFHKKHNPGWPPASICSMPKEGGEFTTYFSSDTIKLGHSSVNPSQTKIVSDNQTRNTNQLVLIDIATGDYETLCWTNSTATEQTNHVHPSFSPSGNKIAFTTDTTGSSQVYVLPL